MGLLRRLLQAALNPEPPYRDPGPVLALLAFRDGLEELQRAHAREAVVNPSLDLRYLHEHRVAWMATRARLASKGYDVSGIKLADIPYEQARAEHELIDAHVEVDRLLQ